MYRNWKEYDRLDKLVTQIYLDYGFDSFPLDEKEVCKKMGVSLVAYSEFDNSDRMLLKKKSKYAFFSPLSKISPPIIFYNDDLNELQSYGCIRLGIFHEIKHYADEDTDEDPADDDLADHFGRYFLAPIPHLIVNDITNPNEIVSRFGTSYTAALNIVSNIVNRRKHYGDTIFDYELPLIRQLDPLYYELFLSGKEGEANECTK